MKTLDDLIAIIETQVAGAPGTPRSLDMMTALTGEGENGLCIAGHARRVLMEQKLVTEEDAGVRSDYFLNVFFGIDEGDAALIVYPKVACRSEHITKVVAIECLKHYRQTAVIDWDRALEVTGTLVTPL